VCWQEVSRNGEAFIASAGADEVIVASTIFDPVARLRSCELLAGACL
jgi:hypothetical protein